MNVSAKVLDILFRRVSPYKILSRLRSGDSIHNPKADHELFKQYAVSNLPEYSLDEQEEIFRKYQYTAIEQQKRIRNSFFDKKSEEPPVPKELSLPEFAFRGVLSMAEQVLTQQVMKPMCKIEQVFLWRELYLTLGQDLFVSAYLAQEDLRKGTTRDFFAWSAILDTNHKQLNNLLERGVAENHQHLYGSSHTFALSWCSAMNYPESHKKLDKEFALLHQPFATVAPEEKMLSTKERVRYACLCRYILFCWLRIRERSKDIADYGTNNRKLLDVLFGRIPPSEDILNELFNGSNDIGISREELLTLLNEPDLEISIIDKFSFGSNNSGICEAALWALFDAPNPEIKVLKGIPLLRMRYGAKIPQRKGRPECIDYALRNRVFLADPDASYRSLAGERSFLYECFQQFLLGNMDTRIQYLFYLYLMLKALVRSEIIQVNQQVGFRNFSNYQDRKDTLFTKDCYYSELLRMAINGPLTEGHVTSHETRITPKKTYAQYLNGMHYLDEEKAFSDMTLMQQQEYPWKVKKKAEDLSLQDAPYFFVYHFIKGPDEQKKLSDLELRCQHQNRRKIVKQQAIALAVSLDRNAYFSQRIRGIDCASHEIGCPPEVFAQAFRYLRSFQHTRYFQKRLFSDEVHHLLSATYHAGEDFLDIASALRTIDEAVEFLELQRGDRIGHALGLGVDSIRHYALKGKRIFIRKQDRLDDLVWLLFRSRELNTSIEYNLAKALEDEAYRLLNDIYGKVIESQKWHIGLRDYYRSMSLRADDPQCYIEMRYNEEHNETHQYDEYAIRHTSQNLDSTRKQKHIAGMYYYYHYDKDVKEKGSETIEVVITPEYMTAMRQAQNALQSALSAKGIIIECNPSSNVLIGTFGSYHAHPIFRFNPPISRHSPNPPESDELQVCVNTDDLGVFDTSQSFEYALLYQALYEARDDKNNRIFTESEIIDYLESLRQAGFTAVFPKANNETFMTMGADMHDRYR